MQPLRMLDLIATLRAARRAITAADLAERLDTSRRTVYRDIAALQAMAVPIDGAAGVGYILRPGFHLPPLNFSPDEAEAITVGLALLRRTGDRGLLAAAETVAAKIAAVQPARAPMAATVMASPWHDQPASAIDPATLRRAIRAERVLHLTYRDAEGGQTQRDVLPLALIYYVDTTVLAGFCTLRQDFRHFRIDRIAACKLGHDDFSARAPALRRAWAAGRTEP